MSPENEQSRIKRIRNDQLTGGISAGHEVERAEHILDAVFGIGRHLSVVDLSDNYPASPHVSIEEAAASQVSLQVALEHEITLENSGVSPVKKGLPPCLRVKNSA